MPKSFGFVLIVFLLLVETLKHDWGVAGCPKNERQALLDFKEGIVDPSNRLSSWFGQDCCMWNGVGCNNQTRHVVKLNLRNSFTFSNDLHTYIDDVLNFEDYYKACLHVQEVKPSLLELKHLKYLDLSCNNFSGISIPKFFGSFQELTYLNLSSALFGGHVPHQIGNLSTLHSLDLSIQSVLSDSNDFKVPELALDTFSWTTHLTSLKFLDMSGIHLGDIKDPVFSSLSSLLELHLSSCMLDVILLQNLTSLVVLDLSDNHLSGPFQSVNRNNMTSLKVLHLSRNQFNSDGPILDQLQNLENLKIIDLSYNYFERKWIESFAKFSPPSFRVGLETLDMSGNEVNGSLPSWLYKFKNLKNLHLSGNSFYGPIPAYFGAMRSLKLLDLGDQRKPLDNEGLSGQIPTFLANNLSSLEVLNLRFNNFNGTIPTSLGELSALRILDLSNNELSGQIPEFFNRLSNLKELYLGYNHLSGQIPMYLGRLITILDLSDNQLDGQIPISLGNMSDLRVLDLHINSLSGPLPMSFGRLSKLEALDLSQNILSGPLPLSFGGLSNLQRIDLSNNLLDRTIPETLGQLSKLVDIYLFNNHFNGVLTELHFATLSRLRGLDLSSNFFSLKIRSGWVPPFQVYSIKLASCQMGPHFPDWLQTQTTVYQLDISNANISGTIPKWLHNLSPNLWMLDLSHNQIHGQVPHFPNTKVAVQLYLSFNNFEGPLPEFFGSWWYLDLSSNHFNGSIPNSLCQVIDMTQIDLSNNHLSGDLPQCLRNSSLLSIDFSSNNLSGTIPSSICHNLNTLLLSKNNFHGKISSGFQECTYLTVLDLGENKLSGKVPNWIGTNPSSLRVIRLRSNKFHGSVSPRLCHLNKLQILDLANNSISGKIPYCLGNLSSMVLDHHPGFGAPGGVKVENTNKVNQVIKGREFGYFRYRMLPLLTNLDLSQNNLVGNIPKELTNLAGLRNLNLSENHLTGDIPKMIGQMKSLESLDFSKNNLSGTIPQSISSLTFLTVLNLSYNNLSGQIPTGSQLQTLEDPSIYIGNTELCGYPLKKCIGDEQPLSPTSVDQKGEVEDEFGMKWFYIGMGSGCVVGFWGFCGVLLFMKTWRHAYFRFFNDIIERLYVAILVRINRLKEKLKHREVEE